MSRGHQVRKQATSWADTAKVDTHVICDAATWKTSSTFVVDYQLDLQHDKRADFGKQHLCLSASTSMEQSLRRSLGPATKSTGSRGCPDNKNKPKSKKR